MKERNKKHLWVKNIALTALSVGLVAIPMGHSEAADDFFTNSQTTDQRSDGTNGNPGYNPCVGGTLTTSSCTGGSGLLTNVAGAFVTAGPGAITDNMFGLVATAALGADGVVGGTGLNADVATTTCSPGLGEAGADPDGLNGLNCGNVRINPAQQGQTIPTDGTNLTAALVSNISMDMNSGVGAEAHRSQVEGGFVWNPTTVATALPVDVTNMPTIAGVTPAALISAAGSCTGVSASVIAVCGLQSMQETTALSASTSVKVDQTTSWSSTVDASGTLLANPTITWAMKINQADVVGTGGAFVQELSGSFEYNQSGTTFPSTQYPNGESVTNGSIAGANLP